MLVDCRTSLSELGTVSSARKDVSKIGAVLSTKKKAGECRVHVARVSQCSVLRT